MDDTLPAGLALAVAAALLFETAYLLQALEARTVATSVRATGVLRRLVVRRRWLLGIALAAGAAALQVAALRLAPLIVVQPALAFGVVALVMVGGRFLGEPASRGDLMAAVVVAVGVTFMALAGRGVQPEPVATVPAAIALASLAALLATSFLLRTAPTLLLVLGAGAGDALAALAAERFAHAWSLIGVVWVVVGVAALVGSLGVEMTAIGRWPATRVGPFVLVCQTVVPVLLAPIVAGEDWRSDAGLVAAGLVLVAAGGWRLARSGGLLEHREAIDDDVRSPRQPEP